MDSRGNRCIVVKDRKRRLLDGERGFMSESKSWRILQIIPAQAGWKAVHCQESGNKEIEISNRPIVCWALVESILEIEAVGTQVRGVEQELNELAVVEDLIHREEEDIGQRGAERDWYFLGYNDPEAHKESDYWARQGMCRILAEKAKKSAKNGERGAIIAPK